MEGFRILLSMAAVHKEGSHLEAAGEDRRIPDPDARKLGLAWQNNWQPLLGEWGFGILNGVQVDSETGVVHRIRDHRIQGLVVQNNLKLGGRQMLGDHRILGVHQVWRP